MPGILMTKDAVQSPEKYARLPPPPPPPAKAKVSELPGAIAGLKSLGGGVTIGDLANQAPATPKPPSNLSRLQELGKKIQGGYNSQQKRKPDSSVW